MHREEAPGQQGEHSCKACKVSGLGTALKKVCEACEFPGNPSMCSQNTHVLTKTVTYAKCMGMHTPHITPQSVTATKKMELLRVELSPIKEEILGMTGIQRIHLCKYSHA